MPTLDFTESSYGARVGASVVHLQILSGSIQNLTSDLRAEFRDSGFYHVPEYSAMCEALVEKFPMLRDSDPDAPFVSYFPYYE